MTGVWDNTRRADYSTKPFQASSRSCHTPRGAKRNVDGDDAFMQNERRLCGNCLLFRMSRSILRPKPLQIIHDTIYLLTPFEQNSMFHIVRTDGCAFTKDLPASWFGESVGRWDGEKPSSRQ